MHETVHKETETLDVSSEKEEKSGFGSMKGNSISAAAALAALPALFVTTTEYWPWLAAPALVTMRLSPVAPAMAVPLNCH